MDESRAIRGRVHAVVRTRPRQPLEPRAPTQPRCISTTQLSG